MAVHIGDEQVKYLKALVSVHSWATCFYLNKCCNLLHRFTTTAAVSSITPSSHQLRSSPTSRRSSRSKANAWAAAICYPFFCQFLLWLFSLRSSPACLHCRQHWGNSVIAINNSAQIKSRCASRCGSSANLSPFECLNMHHGNICVHRTWMVHISVTHLDQCV